jgi:hypothetical protein
MNSKHREVCIVINDEDRERKDRVGGSGTNGQGVPAVIFIAQARGWR